MAAEVVISYSSKDRDRVLPLVERLRAFGVSLWIDYGGIDGALRWSEEIVEAIEACKVMILIASESSVSSANVVREITIASEGGKDILPLHLEPVNVPKAMKWQLAGIQHLELFRHSDEANFTAIARSLKRCGVNISDVSPVQPTSQPKSAPQADAVSPARVRQTPKIASLPRPPTVRITAPKSGDRWLVGTEQEIKWEAEAKDGAQLVGFDLKLMRDNQAVAAISSGTLDKARRSSKWIVAWSSDDANRMGQDGFKIRIIAYDDRGNRAEALSPGTITLAAPAPVLESPIASTAAETAPVTKSNYVADRKASVGGRLAYGIGGALAGALVGWALGGGLKIPVLLSLLGFIIAVVVQEIVRKR